jgi:hypothetical protein
MTDDAKRVGNPDLIDDIHDALDALRDEGVKSFSFEHLRRRVPALAKMPPKWIDRMLLEMRRGGEEIHQDGLCGPDGTNSWSFGYRPAPTPQRRTMGRRSPT